MKLQQSRPFPCSRPSSRGAKIPRLRNEIVTITEKLDGTNAQICITQDGQVFAGSRSRWLGGTDPKTGKTQDNYGFHAWVREHEAELAAGLGVGRHYGEWWGFGIGPRGYGLPEKRLALFNTFRPAESLPGCVGQVPILYQGPGLELSRIVSELMAKLKAEGSVAAPGYMRPEGLVVYSSLTKTRYKVLCEGDDGKKEHPSPEE
jgi:hypothetical protein